MNNDEQHTPKPLPEAVAHGAFGYDEDGPIEPDETSVRQLTREHAAELHALLAESEQIAQAQSDGRDPRTGKLPRGENSRQQLEQWLEAEQQRVTTAYADALAVYEEAFGHEEAEWLDRVVRKVVADYARELHGNDAHQYEPSHPWHYLPEGDGAAPVPVDQINGDVQLGRYLEPDLPKHPVKRRNKLRELLDAERRRLDEDRQRYEELLEWGVSALTEYDRRIAYGGNDERARASTFALKYTHIRLALSRIAWIEQELARDAQLRLFED